MSTIYGIAYSSYSALNAFTRAVDVTNTNIANSETTGYSRQDAVLQTQAAGVEVSRIKRIADAFLTAQVWSAKQDMGKWEAENEALADIEAVFTDSSGSSTYGLDSALTDFWDGWQNVVNDPSSSTARSVLASSAETLAETFNSMSSELTGIQSSLKTEISNCVNSVKEILQQIAQLNQEIAQAKSMGQDINNYKDELDSLVTELSSQLDIKTYENAWGQVCVSTSDGRSLVNGTVACSLGTAVNSTSGLYDITLIDGAGDSTVITDYISSGKMGGYLEVFNKVIPDYQDRLDELAASIIEQVNALHSSGYNLEGDAGTALFSGTSAQDIAVNADILEDPGKIAASSTADGGTGDGSNASAIAALANALMLENATSNYSDFFVALVSKIGNAVDSAQSNFEYQADLVQVRENLRESVSGVLIDEELTKLALYQAAYEAAAKVMSAVDEMLATLINM
jgi:flagellar hook-associated protein 1 FlgK